MAEDGLLGFRFLEVDVNSAKDSAIREATSDMFSEIAFDRTFDHLGIADTAVQDTESGKDVQDYDRSDDFGSFDFTEGFDFIL